MLASLSVCLSGALKKIRFTYRLRSTLNALQPLSSDTPSNTFPPPPRL